MYPDVTPSVSDGSSNEQTTSHSICDSHMIRLYLLGLRKKKTLTWSKPYVRKLGFVHFHENARIFVEMHTFPWKCKKMCAFPVKMCAFSLEMQERSLPTRVISLHVVLCPENPCTKPTLWKPYLWNVKKILACGKQFEVHVLVRCNAVLFMYGMNLRRSDSICDWSKFRDPDRKVHYIHVSHKLIMCL